MVSESFQTGTDHNYFSISGGEWPCMHKPNSRLRACAAFEISLDFFIPSLAAPVEAAEPLSSSIPTKLSFGIQFVQVIIRVLHHQNTSDFTEDTKVTKVEALVVIYTDR